MERYSGPLLTTSFLFSVVLFSTWTTLAQGRDINFQVSWGHQSPENRSFYLRVIPASASIQIEETSYGMEGGDEKQDNAWTTTAGAGDVDGLQIALQVGEEPIGKIQDLHVLWADLIEAADPETARRLYQDPAFHPDSKRLTFQLNREGTLGFSVALEQLTQSRALWIPSLDIFLAVGDDFISFEEHQRTLEEWKGQRVLDQVAAEPEATYEQYTARWEDMGHPSYEQPESRGPGHIVGLSWDSAIHKFGIDRGAGVWPDYGNADKFLFWFEFGDLREGIHQSWKSQQLEDGLPVLKTTFEKEGVRYEVEQFAYPVEGPPRERLGDLQMVLMQRVKVTNLESEFRQIPVTMSHRRQFQGYSAANFNIEEEDGRFLFSEDAFNKAILVIESPTGSLQWSGVKDYQREQRRVNATLTLPVPAGGSSEFVVKLPSPSVSSSGHSTLLQIDYDEARRQTVDFWMDYLQRGARFEVPEKVVNDLIRASLWHSLRLPRRHGGETDDVRIDLPYSNFAYSQEGIPWPINQAVYVDYMIYNLRGYHDMATEELLAMYRANQESNGHITGYANWVVYTPGLLYAVAKNYLLSGSEDDFKKLLPFALKSLDWCLAEIQKAGELNQERVGLVRGPLNDGTGEGIWAFNQAYLYQGLKSFGQALERLGHQRARETLQAANHFYQKIASEFGAASMKSTLVELKDGTWVPYVPCEATTPRRLLDQWYATDVDTGAVHLLRLEALDPRGDLAEYLLHDHEDNLFYKNWGIANEPVYNQQTTAYLLRDNPKAVIRGFYSYLASAFSHSALEPVEHRWTHGQYFGPPSTDGAWFEVLRNMLVREIEGDGLLLGQAPPRKWLEQGKEIRVTRAPTYYGEVSLTIQSETGSNRIKANVETPSRQRPAVLFVRLRHPEAKEIQSVTVNGEPWQDFAVEKEWIRIPSPSEDRYEIVASY